MRIGLVFLLISFSNLVFSQSLEWVGSYQSPLWQQPGGLVLGSDGYVYVSGRFKDDIDMDFGPSSYILNYTGTNVGPDFFVAKYDTLGNLVWARKFGGDIQTTNENELTIGVDGQNNVFICGKYSGFVDFDPGPGLDTIWTPGSNIFFSKYDSNGNYQWTKVINEGQFINDDYPNDMAIDIMGNIIITGAMGSNVDFDPSPTGQFNFPSYSSVDGFVAKYDNNGNFIWAKQLGGKNEGTALATDNTGNIFVGCYFKDSADVDPGLGTMYYTSLGSRDAAVLKLDQNGDFVWCNQIGSPYPSTYGDRINAMTTDSYGNVYAVGFFESTIDFDPGSNVFTVSSFDPDRDFFIVKYDSNGGFVLAEGVGNGGTDQVLDIFVDIQSNIYLVGDFAGVLDLDPSSNVNTVSTTLFRSLYFAMYDPYFNYLHSFSISTGCVTEATIDVDVAGKVYVIGGFEDLVDFDPDSSSDFFMSTSSAINENLFIGKYSFGQCNLFSGILNEALSLDCAQPGLISVTPVGGIAPFQYSWNTIPIVSDSLLQVNSGGFYSVSITDSTGCEIEKVILLEGPTG